MAADNLHWGVHFWDCGSFSTGLVYIGVPSVWKRSVSCGHPPVAVSMASIALDHHSFHPTQGHGHGRGQLKLALSLLGPWLIRHRVGVYSGTIGLEAVG